MAEVDMIGWSIKGTRELIKLCSKFRKAYSDSGQGPSSDLLNLCTKIKIFEGVLEELKTLVKSHDSKLYMNYTSIETTLKDCNAFFEKHPLYLKSLEQRSMPEQLQCTFNYLLSVKDEVDQLCKNVDSHYLSINAYVGLLNAKYNNDLSEKFDRMDTKLNLIIRQQGRYSVAEGSAVNIIGHSSSSTSINVDQAASKQLADLEIDYAILEDLRKKSTTADEIEALDRMISELGILIDRVKNLAERTDNMDAQQRKWGRPIVKHTDSGFVSHSENLLTEDDSEEEERGEESMLDKVIDSGDSAVAFKPSFNINAASTTCRASTSTEPLSPGEKPKDTAQKDDVRIETFDDVEIDIKVEGGRKSFPCMLKAAFCNNNLTEISAKHLEPSEINLPVIAFGNNHPLMIPNILYRGPNAPKRHCVTPMGVNFAICEAISPACAPEYRFASKDESKRFQELTVGKSLVFSINVKSIKSRRIDESKLSVLRIWKDSSSPGDTSLSKHSLMYHHNTETKLERQRPIEISLADFEWPPRKRFAPLELKFKKGKRAEQEYLRITFLEDATKLYSCLQGLK